MYQIIIGRAARKTLSKLTKQEFRSIKARLASLADNPYSSHLNIKKLQGVDAYRLRIGTWRVIYQIDNKIQRIIILKVAHRKEVYR